MQCVSRDSCGAMFVSKHGVVPSPPHTHMPTLPTGGQVSSSATSEASTNRERGGGGGREGATTEQDVRLQDEYQGPHEGVCVHTHTQFDPKECQFLTLEMCVEGLSTAVFIAVHVRVYVCVLFGGTLRLAPNKGRPILCRRA